MAFLPDERMLLLRARRVGPLTVGRLEAAGIDSLESLARIGAARAIEIVGDGLRGSGWKNRRRALEQVLSEWRQGSGDRS